MKNRAPEGHKFAQHFLYNTGCIEDGKKLEKKRKKKSIMRTYNLILISLNHYLIRGRAMSQFTNDSVANLTIFYD